MFKTVDYQLDGGIALLTMSRPDEANSMTMEFMQELEALSNQLSHDPEVRAVVLTGSARFFSTGGDLKTVAGSDNRPGIVAELAQKGGAAVSNFMRMDAPFITAVNGTAAGGGFGLAISGDLVIASEKAKFKIAYPAIGFVPDLGTTYFLVNSVGIKKAKELVLMDEALTANEALDLGLVNWVVSDDELMPEAMKLARRLAEGPKEAYGASKRLMLDAGQTNFEAIMAREVAEVSRAAGSEEGIARVNKFLGID